MATSKRKNHQISRRKARRNNVAGYTTMRIARVGWGRGPRRPRAGEMVD